MVMPIIGDRVWDLKVTATTTKLIAQILIIQNIYMSGVAYLSNALQKLQLAAPKFTVMPF
jgi:hypothetical protein